MANQDSGLINILGTGSVDVNVSVYQNVSIAISGELDASATGVNADYAYANIVGKLGFDISAGTTMNSGLIEISGELSTAVTAQNLVNMPFTVIGGTLDIYAKGIVQCNDLVIDMDLAFIYSEKCDIKGNSMELIRYRGDTYPITCVLSQNGNTDISGQTFEMSMQIAGGTIYTVAGSVINAGMGMVTFIPDPLAVELSGVGFYDIQSNDGTYDYTYEKGVFTLLEDLTV